MNDFSSKPIKFLYFEIARLRTLYDSKPEIREAIIERYGQVVKELDGRGAKWFWAPHLIDQFIDIKKAFIKPNKPAWRIFTPEEVFDISGFELPVLVDVKIDGMRLQIHNDAGVQIYSEDEGLNKTHKFKEPLEDIKKLPEGTILDAEGVLVADGQVLHRTSFIGYVNGKGFDEEKDKQTEFWIFDVLRWGNKDLTDEPLSVRLSYLKKVPECKHLKVFKAGEEAFICKTREEVLTAVKKVAGKKGSEGAMIKLLSSTYVKDIHNKGWIKLKNLKEVDCLVVEIESPEHQKGPLEGKPVEGVFNYHVAAGPYPEEDGKVLLDKVPTKVREYEGKVYAHLGKTFNTEIKAKVGDIIRVWSPEINKYPVKETDLFTYGIYEPKVLEWVHERNIPDSLNVLNRLAEETSELHPREVAKQDEGGDGGHWVTVNGRHIFIGDEEQGNWEVNYEKVSGSRQKVGEKTYLYNQDSDAFPEEEKKKISSALLLEDNKIKNRFSSVLLTKGKDYFGMNWREFDGEKWANTLEISNSSPEAVMTMEHEFGHEYTNYAREEGLNEEFEMDFKKARKTDGLDTSAFSLTPEQSKKDIDEDIANAYAAYVVDPKALKEASPNRYEAIRGLVEKVRGKP
jgi:hypothetical protein